jgi:hypothetical protein
MFFNNNKLSRAESDVVLESMIGFLQDGQTVYKSLKFSGEIFGGKIEKIVGLIEHEIIDNSMNMNDALFLYGILTEEEASLFSENGGKAKDSIADIINLRKYGSEYEKIIWNGLKNTFYMFVATSVGMFIYADELVAQLAQIVKDSATAEIQAIGSMGIMPAFLENKWILIYQVVAVIVLMAGVRFLYKWYYDNDRKVIYQIFRKKAYDDIPRLFQIMSKMQKSGKYTTIAVFDEMMRSGSYRGLSGLFYNLHEAALSGENLFVHFQMAHFPKDIVTLIRAKEDTDFWSGMESLVTFAQNKANTEYEKMRGYYSIVSMVLPWVYPGYIMMTLSVTLTGAMNVV